MSDAVQHLFGAVNLTAAMLGASVVIPLFVSEIRK